MAPAARTPVDLTVCSKTDYFLYLPRNGSCELTLCRSTHRRWSQWPSPSRLGPDYLRCLSSFFTSIVTEVRCSPQVPRIWDIRENQRLVNLNRIRPNRAQAIPGKPMCGSGARTDGALAAWLGSDAKLAGSRTVARIACLERTVGTFGGTHGKTYFVRWPSPSRTITDYWCPPDCSPERLSDSLCPPNEGVGICRLILATYPPLQESI